MNKFSDKIFSEVDVTGAELWDVDLQKPMTRLNPKKEMTALEILRSLEDLTKHIRRMNEVRESMIDLVDKVFEPAPKSNVGDLSHMTYSEFSDYHKSIRSKFQIKHAIWSMDQIDLERVEGLKLIAENIDFSKVKRMRALDSDVSIPAAGIKVAADIMILFDDLVKETGDQHHIFMEGLRVVEEDMLVIHTGS